MMSIKEHKLISSQYICKELNNGVLNALPLLYYTSKYLTLVYVIVVIKLP